MSSQSGTPSFFSNAANWAAKSISTSTEGDKLGQPERQRGLWSFLTWSFFLANFLTATDMMGGHAQAATSTAGPGDDAHSSGDSATSPGPALPGVQHAVLEAIPPEAAPQAPETKIALNAVDLTGLGGPPAVEAPQAPVGSQPMQTSMGSMTSPSLLFDTVNNYYSSDSHDTTSTTVNNYTTIDTHDTINTVTNIIDAVVPPVLTTVTDIVDSLPPVVDQVVDTVVGTVSTAVEDVGQLVDTVLPAVTTVLGDTVPAIVSDLGDVVSTVPHILSDVVDTVLPTVTTALTDTVPAVVSDVADVVSTVPHIVSDVVDTVLPVVTTALTDTVPTVVSDVADVVSTVPQIVSDVVDTALPTISTVLSAVDPIVVPDLGGAIDLDGVTNPLATVVDQGNPISALLSPDTTPAGGDTPIDLVHSLVSDIGISSSGSLNFAAEAPAAIASPDEAPTGTSYTQYNLAVQDASVSADASTSASTDTGGITTIITSALGIGAQANTPTNDHSHDSDPSPTHTSLIDDLHTHLHSGLFG
jgi:hypothetical protein